MKKVKGILSLILIVSMCLFPTYSSNAVTYPTSGVISTTTAGIYDGAGTKDHNYIASLSKGTEVIVLGEAIDWEGDMWYHIKYDTNYSKQGYVYSGRCQLTGTVIDDPKFDAALQAQGFPESYQTALKKLHSLYPNWTFKALHTGLDWGTVLDNEAQPQRSLIPSSYSNSYKSYEQGCYNWDKNDFIYCDTGSWVNASRETIAYYMDPRNFANDIEIFQFLSLSYSSSETSTGVKAILSGSFMDAAYPTGYSDSSAYSTYADAFIAAAKESGVSAFHLASRALQEQGTSGTSLGLGTVSGYKGYFNLFNYGASGSNASEVITNGANYAKEQGWNTPYKSIVGAAKKIAASYINKGQVNTYLQKFDVVDGGNGYYAYQYMQNIIAPSSEAKNTKAAYTSSQLNSLNLEFTLPVYKNMPDSACVLPKSSGNNNNLLKSLSVSGYSIGTFNRYTHSYELVVGSGVSSVTVNAAASDSGATVTGTGAKALNYGNNTLTVKVTASNGISRNYTITVFREGSAAKPYITSSTYTIGTYITGVAPDTAVSTALSKLTANSCEIKLFTSGGAQKTSGNIVTGDTVKVYVNGKVVAEFPFVIYGDTNGDGAINTLDLLRGHKHFLGINKLSGAQLKACDMNKDGSYNTVDLLRGQKYLLGIISDLQK